MQQAVLYHLKLELTHGAYKLTIAGLLGEELCHTLICELADAFLELLGFHRIGIDQFLEDLRGESRYAAYLKVLSLGKDVRYLKVARVIEAYYITGICLVYDVLVRCHEGDWRAEAEVLLEAHMVVVLAAFKLARHDTHKGDTVAVLRVEVGVDLKDEAGHLGLLWLYKALVTLAALWGGSDVYEGIEHLLYAEAIDRRAEEDRSEVALQVLLPIERVIDTFYHLYVLA